MKIFNLLTQKYFCRFILRNLFGELSLNEILNYLEFDKTKSFSLADFGSGAGYYVHSFARIPSNKVVYALDNNEKNFDVMSDILNKQNLLHKVEILPVDISENCKLKEKSVDYVLCSFVIDYMNRQNKEKTINNIKKAVSDTGKVYVSFFKNTQFIKKIGFNYVLDESVTKQLFTDAGFEIIKEVHNKFVCSLFLKNK